MATRGRRDNQGNYSGLVFAVPEDIELESLEKLGPQTRRAICESPMKFSAFQILSDLVAKGYNPKNPHFDMFMARGVKLEGLKVLLRDCDPQAAQMGITPMVPKPRGVSDLRVLRAERAAERRARRFMRR